MDYGSCTVDLHHGKCHEVMAQMEPDAVDTIITDPPYGLEFMGKDWDKLGKINSGRTRAENELTAISRGPESYKAGKPAQDWHCEWAKAALRVAKPGAMLLAFGGTRTHHRLMCGLEDAGWEIRDCLMWLYGSGFPKSHDLGKATQAEEWDGYGTALKPAWEPIILAMKPREGTFATNALVHGVAGLWVDGSRVSVSDAQYAQNCSGDRGHEENRKRGLDFQMGCGHASYMGRWPANLVLSHTEDCRCIGTRRVRGITGGTGNHDGQVYGSRTNQGEPVKDYTDPDGMETVEAWECSEDCSIRLLDEQSGTLTSGRAPDSGFVRHTDKHRATYGRFQGKRDEPTVLHGDSGGASRFFYCAKAPKREKWFYCAICDDAFPVSTVDDHAHGKEARERKHIVRHPTQKPLELMRYFVRLTKTPTGGVVLDAFVGTGSTGEACILEGRPFVGIDKDRASYVTAQRRLEWAQTQARQLELFQVR